MASQFFGLTIAGSGLSAYQAAINVTANNVSNVKTEGYTRQVVEQSAAEALRVNAKYGMIGSGTEATDIVQIREAYYDDKYRANNSRYGEYSTKYMYLQQVETTFKDDTSITGFSTIFNQMYGTLEDLLTNPSDNSYRTQFINSAQGFAEYFNQTAQTLQNMQKDANSAIYSKVSEINSIANQISLLNKQINTIEVQGTHANDLRDQRNLLIDELSALVPVEIEETDIINSNSPDFKTGATAFKLTINGHVLVDNYSYNSIKCVARDYQLNQNDALGLYDLYWSNDESYINMSTDSLTGELKGLFDLRDGNNCENFTGMVNSITEREVFDTSTGTNKYYSTVKVTKPSQDTVDELTIGSEGKIKLGTAIFNYEGFEVDDEGNYYFFIDEKIKFADMYSGERASIGESVNYKGVPYYMAQLNEFCRTFAKALNDIQAEGQDAYGKATGLLFTGRDVVTGEDLKLDENLSSTNDSYYKLTAANFTVRNELFKDANLLSTSSDTTKGQEYHDIVEKMADAFVKDTLFRGTTAEKFLETVLSDIAIDTGKVKTFSQNYQNILNTIKTQRMSISGVDEDEEAMSLIKYQNAYNLSSKMVQVLSEVYDRLILETGV